MRAKFLHILDVGCNFHARTLLLHTNSHLLLSWPSKHIEPDKCYNTKPHVCNCASELWAGANYITSLSSIRKGRDVAYNTGNITATTPNFQQCTKQIGQKRCIPWSENVASLLACFERLSSILPLLPNFPFLRRSQCCFSQLGDCHEIWCKLYTIGAITTSYFVYIY
jgi:hypothetical protein